MTKTTKRNGFTKLNGSTFTCATCGRTTRNTGAQSVGSAICPQCYELAGIENDAMNGASDYDQLVAGLLNEVIARGGHVDGWRRMLNRYFPALAARY